MKTKRAQAQSILPILKRADFLRIAAAGRKWVTPAFILQIADSQSCHLGLTITKKVFKNAVDRNRVRRRLRSMVIDTLSADPPKLDIVMIARAPALKTARAALEKDLKWALKRLLAADKGKKEEVSGQNAP